MSDWIQVDMIFENGDEVPDGYIKLPGVPRIGEQVALCNGGGRYRVIDVLWGDHMAAVNLVVETDNT
jgi:hypothetical protein